MPNKIEIIEIEESPAGEDEDANYLAQLVDEDGNILKIAYGKTQAGALDNLLSK